MTRRNAEFLLASVIIARSTSYLLMKIGLGSMAPFTMLALRFLLAFVLLSLLFGRRMLKIRLSTLGRGALLGGAYFAVMATQTFALKSTSSSAVSFLESIAIAFVPLLGALLHKKLPKVRTLLATLLCIAGVALLTLKGSALTLTPGEWLCLCSAFLYAVSILLTGYLAEREDPLLLGILQVGFMGFFSLLAAFLFETPRLPCGLQEWGVILALAVVCSAFGFTLQPVAQRYATAERAGQFCALTPLSAALLGRLFLQERLGAAGVIGAALILFGVLYAGRESTDA